MTRHRDESSGGNILGAAILGALAGAAAVFLSNKENRDMLKNKANNMMDEGKQNLRELEDTTREKAVKKLDEAKQKVKKK